MDSFKKTLSGDKKKDVRKTACLRCQVCGRPVNPEEAGWEEDSDMGMFCQDCRAEKDSCGCSD